MLNKRVEMTDCLASEFMAPRLTVVITTVNEKGTVNAAPFSFFTPLSYDPPRVCFSVKPQKHHQALQYGLHTEKETQAEPVLDREEYSDEDLKTYKDTLEFVLEKEEFGVNLLPAEETYLEAVVKMSQRWPVEENEIVRAGLTPQESSTIDPPLIKESYAALECELMEYVPVGENRPQKHTEELPYHLLIGEGVALTIDASIQDGSDVPAGRLNPMLQFTGGIFGICDEIVQLNRYSYPEEYTTPDE